MRKDGPAMLFVIGAILWSGRSRLDEECGSNKVRAIKKTILEYAQYERNWESGG
jgi:hypothetical protein